MFDTVPSAQLRALSMSHLIRAEGSVTGKPEAQRAQPTTEFKTRCPHFVSWVFAGMTVTPCFWGLKRPTTVSRHGLLQFVSFILCPSPCMNAIQSEGPWPASGQIEIVPGPMNWHFWKGTTRKISPGPQLGLEN